jgi:RNA polymerase sigma-70 factor (ECF subfamily)
MNSLQPEMAETEPQAGSTTGVGRIQEAIWILQAQQGDEEAFGRLVDRYDRKLVCYLMRFTAGPEEALDIAQDVWISVFRGLRKLQHPGAFRAWLYQIAHARIVSHIRKQVREEQVLESFSAEQEEGFSENEPISGDTELVRNTLAALSAEHREVLALRFLEDMSLEEIAQALACRLGTVKSRLHYAKQALKQQIQSETHHEHS